MTTIARINTSISDHNVAANSMALFILVCVSVFSALVTIHTGNLVRSDYNTLLQSTQATQQVTETPASKVQSNQQTSILVLAQSNSFLTHLQPAQGTANYGVESTIFLQPTANAAQEASSNIQSTASLQ